MRFASSESAGAAARVVTPASSNGHTTAAGGGGQLMEASMEQLTIPLPPWAIRAGARKDIFFDPSQVRASCPASC